MPMPTTLDEYRHAIAHAHNNAQLELLVYRALPALYADMGMEYVEHARASVATGLERRDNGWQLWFNIESPRAIAALTHLHPVVFDRMSGGMHQASSITKGAYGAGFSQETVAFSLEEVFEQNNARIASRLNAATSLDDWWNAFCEELPWGLFQARGWTEPTPEQWSLAQEQAYAFQDKYRASMESYMLLSGKLGADGDVHIATEWSNRATAFPAGIDRFFYPMFGHLPWMTLDRSSLHAFHIKTLDMHGLTAGIQQRAKEAVRVHCGLTGTRYMPVWQVREAVAHPPEYLAPTQSTDDVGQHSPSPF